MVQHESMCRYASSGVLFVYRYLRYLQYRYIRLLGTGEAVIITAALLFYQVNSPPPTVHYTTYTH